MAQIKKLSEIKVGSLVKVGGETYSVTRNLIVDLELKSGIFTRKLSELSPTVKVLKQGSLVEVLAEPTTKENLTDQFKKQLGKQSLADQLRNQIAQQESFEVEDCCDCEDCEDCEEEDEDDDSPFSSAPSVDAQARLTASLTAQSLKGVKAQVGFQGKSIANLRENVEGLSGALDYISEDLYQVRGDVHSHIHQLVEETQEGFDQIVTQSNQVFGKFDGRISKLEAKENARMFQDKVQAQLNEKLQNKKSEKGGVKMNNLLGNFKGLFGKVEGIFALSPAGIAIKKNPFATDYVVYDRETGRITDVNSMVLDFKVPAFRLPVEAKDIKIGNIVVNNGDYGYVTEVVDDYVKVIYPTKAAQGTVLPVTNFLFGKPFYTVVQTIDAAAQGGFNPALLLAMGDGKKDDILPFLLMSGGLGGGTAGAIDPTMLMLLGDNTDELLPFLLMQQGGITQEGFNPLMLLALSGKGGSKKDSLLPLLMMQGQGGQAGGINPMMLMLLGDGDIDPMTLMMMSGQGGGFGGLFGAQPVAPAVKTKTTKASE